jgi:hypothetical protein
MSFYAQIRALKEQKKNLLFKKRQSFLGTDKLGNQHKSSLLLLVISISGDYNLCFKALSLWVRDMIYKLCFCWNMTLSISINNQ